jgi:hypothetical protein
MQCMQLARADNAAFGGTVEHSCSHVTDQRRQLLRMNTNRKNLPGNAGQVDDFSFDTLEMQWSMQGGAVCCGRSGI